MSMTPGKTKPTHESPRHFIEQLILKGPDRSRSDVLEVDPRLVRILNDATRSENADGTVRVVLAALMATTHTSAGADASSANRYTTGNCELFLRLEKLTKFVKLSVDKSLVPADI
ncbi:hypothetical protein PR003_g3594 [Phytophthora rubi]|uniref:Uncharacterized protein n=1 Tax=Phytophthora rubi TaxID=129364 RepID=A0A6A4G3T1_9STRA|nr:hypothetical protein PR003_g3594 [Phytophthora rubi]